MTMMITITMPEIPPGDSRGAGGAATREPRQVSPSSLAHAEKGKKINDTCII